MYRGPLDKDDPASTLLDSDSVRIVRHLVFELKYSEIGGGTIWVQIREEALLLLPIPTYSNLTNLKTVPQLRGEKDGSVSTQGELLLGLRSHEFVGSRESATGLLKISSNHTTLHFCHQTGGHVCDLVLSAAWFYFT
jgi:hypothetical protein